MSRIGVRAFHAIGDLFRTEDTLTVGELDLRIVSSVLNMQNVMDQSLGRFSRFIRTDACTSAANPNSRNCRFSNLVDWDSIFTSAGDGIGVPGGGGQDLWVVGLSVFIGTPANFTDAQFVMAQTAGVEYAIQRWTDELDGIAIPDGLGGHMLGGSKINQRTNGAFSADFRCNVSGDTDVTIIADVISGPRGLFPRLP